MENQEKETSSLQSAPLPMTDGEILPPETPLAAAEEEKAAQDTLHASAPLDESEVESLSDQVKIISPMRMVLRRFFRSKLSVVGLCTMVALLLFCFVGPIFVGWDPALPDSTTGGTNYTTFSKTFTGADGETYTVYYVEEYQYQTNKFAPCFSHAIDRDGTERLHILGTDNEGYDVLSRLMYGGRVSLSLSLLVVLVNSALGVVLGGIAGYFGKWVDMLIMRIVDVINCIPTLPILLIVGAILDNNGVPKEWRIYLMMAALTVISWTGTARLVRGQILALREQEYMTAAEALGLPISHKIFKHLVPNVMPQLIVSMTLSLGSMILYEATLGYLDLGVPYPQPSWGNMIFLAKDADILSFYPNIWIPSGVCIVLAILAFNFIGDGLRDALDPKMKR